MCVLFCTKYYRKPISNDIFPKVQTNHVQNLKIKQQQQQEEVGTYFFMP